MDRKEVPPPQPASWPRAGPQGKGKGPPGSVRQKCSAGTRVQCQLGRRVWQGDSSSHLWASPKWPFLCTPLAWGLEGTLLTPWEKEVPVPAPLPSLLKGSNPKMPLWRGSWALGWQSLHLPGLWALQVLDREDVAWKHLALVDVGQTWRGKRPDGRWGLLWEVEGMSLAERHWFPPAESTSLTWKEMQRHLPPDHPCSFQKLSAAWKARRVSAPGRLSARRPLGQVELGARHGAPNLCCSAGGGSQLWVRLHSRIPASRSKVLVWLTRRNRLRFQLQRELKTSVATASASVTTQKV